jgi:hypothetical protein
MRLMHEKNVETIKVLHNRAIAASGNAKGSRLRAQSRMPHLTTYIATDDPNRNLVLLLPAP